MTKKTKKINHVIEQFNFFDNLTLDNKEEIEIKEKEDGISRRSLGEQQEIRVVGDKNLEQVDDQQSQGNGTNDERGLRDRIINDIRATGGGRESDVGTAYESSRLSGIDGYQSSRGISEARRDSVRLELKKEAYSLTQEDTASFMLGKKAKTKNSIEAIKLSQNLKINKQTPTKEQQSILAKYIGFGGVPQLFNEDNSDYEELRNELKNIVNKKEYETLKESTSDSFYTNKVLVDGIYKILERTGYLDKTGLSVLEPSCGSGNFIGYMPQTFRDNNKIYGFELNSISTQIAKQLYQNNKISIKNKAYQDVNLNNNKFDVIIGNFPFGRQVIYDKHSSLASGKNLHNYFLTKSIESLNHKGLLVAITSSQFLNDKSPHTREDIDKIADFVGTIRLPKEAFKTADTEASCDIVIFQKNDKKIIDKEVYKNEEYWTNQNYQRENSILRENYFIATIGKRKYEKNQYGDYHFIYSEAFENIESKLEENINHLVEDISKEFVKQEKSKVEEKEIIYYELSKDIFVGEYLITKDGRVGKRIADDIDGSRIELVTGSNQQKYKDFINLKQTVKYLLEAEIEDKNEKEIFDFRKQLIMEYTGFINQYGGLHEKNNKNFILEDIKGRLVLELESKDKQGNIKRANILDRRLIKNKKAEIKGLEDAMYHSVVSKGKVDIEYIANLKELNFNGDKIKVIKGIEGLGIGYYNPKEKEWQIKEQYLSGNIVEKLEELENYINNEEEYNFKRNKIALEKVMPKQIGIGDIGVDITAGWVPLEYKKNFINKLLKGTDKGNCFERFDYVALTATYDIKINDYAVLDNLNTREYGTSELSAIDIITKMFKKQSIEIKREISVPGKKSEIIINQEETELALEKVELIKEKWQEYIIENPYVAKDIEDRYNKIFNNYVVPNYSNGEQLVLPSSNKDITLRLHQKRAVLRGILEDRYLLDHAVGAGKTYTMIATIMERKRLGLNNKPILVVPNHIVGQWRDSFKELYPNTNILCTDEKNFTKDKRESFLAKIALNNWDCIIMSHSSFEKIPLNEEYVKGHILKELNLIDEIISSTPEKSFTAKHLKKLKEGYTSKLEKMQDESKKDKTLNFDNLGLDELYVDEAHEFKNLQFHTKQGDIRGINPRGSNKAYDLYMKCQYIQEKKEELTGKKSKGVYFATGTPISNSLAELFTISRYLDGRTLQEKGISHFDEWCNTFAEVKEEWQVATTGNGFEKRKMFSSFKNIPELSKMYLQYGDIILNNDIKDYIKLPKIENEKANNIALEPTKEQKDFMSTIITRMVEIKSGKVPPQEDNHLKICTDARKASVDMRVVSPEYNACDKVMRISDNVVDLYNKWQEDKGTQLVFLDISTPKSNSTSKSIKQREFDAEKVVELDNGRMGVWGKLENNFSLYHDLRERLINKGIKKEEIAFIHDYKKDEDKTKLFKAMNDGDIRVLIGSSQKMGAGMNVQERLVGLHHFDAPWRPTDLEQREGRIIRQGNKLLDKYGDKFKVTINRYSTKYTYDTRLWQILENKAKFINDFKKGNVKTRSNEDIGEGDIKSVEEMKAIASGNPYLLLLTKLESEYKRKNNIYKRNVSDRQQMQIAINSYSQGNHEEINKLEDKIKLYENLKNNNSCSFKIELRKDNKYVMHEEKSNIILYLDEKEPTELQEKHRKERFPEILLEKIEELSNKKSNIVKDIEYSKQLLLKPLDNKEIINLKEDIEGCKEILNKMNLTTENMEKVENKEELYFIPKSKGFDKEIVEINKFFNKKTEQSVAFTVTQYTFDHNMRIQKLGVQKIYNK